MSSIRAAADVVHIPSKNSWRKAPGPLIPEEGLEPSIPFEKRILNPPRMPIPPLRLGNFPMMAKVRPNRKRRVDVE